MVGSHSRDEFDDMSLSDEDLDALEQTADAPSNVAVESLGEEVSGFRVTRYGVTVVCQWDAVLTSKHLADAVSMTRSMLVVPLGRINLFLMDMAVRCSCWGP